MSTVDEPDGGREPTKANDEVRAAMVAHHAGLVAGLDELVGRAEEEVASGSDAGGELKAVVSYLDREVLPHAAAEEASLYGLARRAGLDPLVQAMVGEHAWLRGQTAALVGKVGVRGVSQARALAAVFALHAGKENDLILPELAARPEVDLGAVLSAMQSQLSQGPEGRGTPREAARSSS